MAGPLSLFSQGEYRKKITGSTVFVKPVLCLHESSLALQTEIQLLGGRFPLQVSFELWGSIMQRGGHRHGFNSKKFPA